MPCLDNIDRSRIQKVQNSCLRLVYGVRRRHHISPYLLESGWLSMFNRSKLHSILFYLKIIEFKTPPYLYQKIRFRTDVHNLNLRRRIVLTVPQHRKEIFKRSFSYNVAHFINSLETFDFGQSLSTIKHKLKSQFLLSQR